MSNEYRRIVQRVDDVGLTRGNLHEVSRFHFAPHVVLFPKRALADFRDAGFGKLSLLFL
jgi:hypothetical protein